MQRPSSRLITQHAIVDQFHKAQVKAVINLQLSGEHPHCGDGIGSSGFSYRTEDFTDHGIRYYNPGWVDMHTPSMEKMLEIVQLVQSHTDKGDKVAVHCHAGYGRTGIAIACFFVYAKRMSAERAIQWVQDRRSGCVQTSKQTQFVHAFAAYAQCTIPKSCRGAKPTSIVAASSTPSNWTICFVVAYNNALDMYLASDLAKLVYTTSHCSSRIVWHFLISTRAHPVPYHVRVVGPLHMGFWEPPIHTKQSPSLYHGRDPLADVERFLHTVKYTDYVRNHFALFFNGDGGCIYFGGNETLPPQSPPQKTYISIPAFAAMLQRIRMHFAILAFDCCTMATIETAFALRHCASVLLCTEQYEGGVGFNAPALVRAFYTHTAATDIAQTIASDYIRRVNVQSELTAQDTLDDLRDVTVVHTVHVSALVHCAHRLIVCTKDETTKPQPSVDPAWIDPDPDDETAYVDLYTTLEQRAHRVKPVEPLWMQFKQLFQQCVWYKQNNGMKQTRTKTMQADRFHGLSVCIDMHADSCDAAACYVELDMLSLFVEVDTSKKHGAASAAASAASAAPSRSTAVRFLPSH